ncbi:MAG: PAS domain-containing protein, partial [Methanoregula sp.]
MTERPGRKALFTGADTQVPQISPSEESASIRKSEQTIAELRQRLEMMVSKNPVPMLLTTPAFSIVEANAAYIQMSGIKESDLLKTNLKNFKILSQKGEGAKVAIQEKRRSFGEVIVELPSGVRILEQYCIPIVGTDQIISSLLFVYNDITVQKKRVDEIEQLKHRSEMIVQQNPIPILMTNPGFAVIEANTAYIKMSGIPRDRVIGMSLREVKILEQKGEGARVALEKKQRAFGEVTVELPSGTHILEQYVIPILDAKNEISHLLFVYNEITEQRKSHEDLQKKMDEVALLKLRSDIIVNQNPMPIMLMTTSFKIMMANDAYISMTGLAKDRLIGMSAKDFKILEQHGEGLKKVLQEKKRSFGEIKIEFPTGIHILNQWGIPMVDPKGILQTIVCVYTDITTQREQES